MDQATRIVKDRVQAGGADPVSSVVRGQNPRPRRKSDLASFGNRIIMTIRRCQKAPANVLPLLERTGKLQTGEYG